MSLIGTLNESDSRRKSHESDRHSESCHSYYDEIRRHFIVDILNVNQDIEIKANGIE